MLKLKLQYFDAKYWMQRASSLEKTPMLGKMEGKRRRGWQRMIGVREGSRILGWFLFSCSVVFDSL